MKGKDSLENKKGPLWAMLQKVEGDKVILIIVLLLLLVSFLAIFSSTPMLPAQESRLKTMTEHGIVALLGIGVMFVLYHIRVQWLKPFARLGFIFSVILLSMLLFEVNIPGIIKTQKGRHQWQNYSYQRTMNRSLLLWRPRGPSRRSRTIFSRNWHTA
jgi:cell division protein FtsW (lipid II flippase)